MIERPRSALAVLALSAAALVGLVANEGYSDKAIIPVPGDVPTIGFGSTTRDDGTPVQSGDHTTPPKALGKALRDVQAYEGRLKRCVTVPLTQGEYDAYVSLMYNIGPAAFCSSSIPSKLAAGDYEAACATILEFDGFRDRSKPKVKNPKTGKMEYPLIRLRGLTLRRQTENKRCTGEAS